MRALLDTNAFLWFISGNEKLSVNARKHIAEFENELFLSVASLWEIAIKTSLGKLELLQPFEDLIPAQLDENAIHVLAIKLSHLSAIIKLPFHHRDPFDRLIIAQCMIEELPVITNDGVFSNYPINVIW